MVHTRPKGSEDSSLYEGANKGTAHKRGSDRATAIGDRMRAAKAAKRDAEAQAAPVVVNQPSETSQLLLTYRTYFHPSSGPTSKPRSRGRTARQSFAQFFTLFTAMSSVSSPSPMDVSGHAS